MNLFFDVAVSAVLLGVALDHVLGFDSGPAAAGAAALAPCWLAVVTPALVRSDVTRRRLPNAYTVPAVGLVVVGAAGEWVAGGGGRDPALALALVAICAVGGSIVSVRGGIGLGDVKLASGLAGSLALVDPEALPLAALVTATAGIVGAASTGLRSGARSHGGIARGSPTIAYGPCLLIGYWAALAFAGAPWLTGVRGFAGAPWLTG